LKDFSFQGKIFHGFIEKSFYGSKNPGRILNTIDYFITVNEQSFQFIFYIQELQLVIRSFDGFNTIRLKTNYPNNISPETSVDFMVRMLKQRAFL
jgi:hypothetical protein